jgi:hypothetical protein
MKRTVAATGLLFLFSLFGACSGNGDDPPRLADPVGSSGGRASVGSGGGSNGGAAPASVYAPVVEIISPETDDEPTASNVLTSGKVEVTCSATRSPEATSLPVDPGSVEIVAMDADGEIIDELAGSPTGDDEYVAELTLPADLENGVVTIRCSASDEADDPNEGSATAEYFFDNGPAITLVSPSDESAHPAASPVGIEFRAEALPVTDDDPEAAVAEVMLLLEGIEIELDEDEPGVFTASVDFLDASLFPELPSGSINVVIRATNERGIERTATSSFVLDGAGPIITMVSPRTQAIVDEETTLEFTVEDPLSGVDEDSVFVVISGESYQFDPTGDWVRDGDTFYFTFDATTIDEAIWQVNINVQAEDVVGNFSEGESHILYLDYEPPIVSLDPPNVRELKTAPDPDQCSASFDPVGAWAENDGDVVGGNPRLRAIVWDKTNESPDGNTRHYAQVEPSSVRLYLQPDIATGVIEDTDGDGVCDEIIDRDELTFQDLSGLTPTGSSANSDGDFDEVPAVTLYEDPLPADAQPPICEDTGFSTSPKGLCGENSEMTRVIKHTMVASPAERVIYVVGKQLSSVDCTGEQWEITSSMTGGVEGWMCLAVRAADTVGNIGVSRPLRLCVDIPGIDGTPSCLAEDMPSCRLDDCALPPTLPAMVIDID